jgi:prepilin-type N-terminal cleavage/methylation domain-containing protein
MNRNLKSGFTLLEMTVVILVLLTLIGTGLFVSNKYNEWQLGRTASEELRNVYAAQRLFLADNPTVAVIDITADDVIPYLTNRGTAIPTVKSLDGDDLPIKVNASPPVILNGAGENYDPSNTTTDSLWDVGP